MLRFSAVTLFPEMFATLRNEGVISRAIQQGLISLDTVFLREFGLTDRRNVDDRPIGGGDGMLLRADVVDAALQSCVTDDSYVVHLTPAGEVFSATTAKMLAQKKHIVFMCGRYGGFDARVVDKWADANMSLGDFVLSGGELPAMAMMDAVARFVPQVLGNTDSAQNDSFEDGLLEAPAFTKPLEFNGVSVPPILLSGDHQKIAQYRRHEQLRITAKIRPELVRSAWSQLDKGERELVEKIWNEPR